MQKPTNLITTRLKALFPDFGEVFSRFPMPVIGLIVQTALVVSLANEWISGDAEWTWRLLVALLIFTIFAIAGQVFHESNTQHRRLSLALRFALPLILAACFFLPDQRWAVPQLLPVVGLLFLSVVAFIFPNPHDGQSETQNKFWWLNHRAAATAAIAILGAALVGLGLLALERSLDFLFGIDASRIAYAFILPVVFAFLTPLYWLSTVERLENYVPSELITPDFLSKAIGFLGQFVLTPLLLAYALLLLAYAAQVVLTGELPPGVLGWMVLAFTVTGAANWLVLHPPFMQERKMVRLFNKIWFWLTIVPLILFALALQTRISAYGLTQERVLLVAAGIWAIALALIFLTRKWADIRWIPGAAALIFLPLALGPWNLVSIPVMDQTNRLNTALDSKNNSGADWRTEDAAVVRSSLRFLLREEIGEAAVKNSLLERGFDVPEELEFTQLRALLSLPADRATPTEVTETYRSFAENPQQIDGTAKFFGDASFGDYEARFLNLGTAELSGNRLTISSEAGQVTQIELADWLAISSPNLADAPPITIDIDQRKFVFWASSLTISTNDEGEREVRNLLGIVFEVLEEAPS